MHYLFCETRIVFLRAKHSERGPESRDDAEIAAEGLDKGTYKDAREAQNVLLKQSALRRRLEGSDLFTDEDKAMWKKKLQDAEQRAISRSEMEKIEMEFARQQEEISGMVDNYSRKVIDNKEAAFTVDASRNLDTAKGYIEWFSKQPYDEKLKLLKFIDDDIDERKELRRKLLKKLDKKEVIKMRRSEMKDKVKELEVVENNLSKYKQMLEKDKRIFHDINLYLEAFADLTPIEQENWMKRYEDDIAIPRRELVETHDSLPKEFQSSKFLRMPSTEKKKYLEEVEAKIERIYINEVNKIPTKIWSDESKRFAIEDFRRLKDITTKAQWLEFLPKAKKAEENLMEQYSDDKFKKVRKLEAYSKKKWEKCRFEDKERMLKSMEAEALLMDVFTDVLQKECKDKVISEKTEKRYMDMYKEMDLNGRRLAVRNILFAMKPRRDLLNDFEELSAETQKEFKDFYKRGHKARLEIFKKAKKHEEKLKAKEATDENDEEISEKAEEKAPQSLEQSDIQEIIAELHHEADNYEEMGQLEKALVSHQSVLKLHPEDEYSKKKVEQLQMEIETLETLSDDTVLAAVEQETQTGGIKEELENIRLAGTILKDREKVIRKSLGKEDLGRQTVHLSEEKFDQEVHGNLYDISGGKKILNEHGQTEEVEEIDVDHLGTRPNDTTQIKKDIRELGTEDNLSNIQLKDSNSGRKLRLSEAEEQLDKRKERTTKEVAKRARQKGGLKKAEEKEVLSAADELIDEELEQEYRAA